MSSENHLGRPLRPKEPTKPQNDVPVFTGLNGEAPNIFTYSPEFINPDLSRFVDPAFIDFINHNNHSVSDFTNRTSDTEYDGRISSYSEVSGSIPKISSFEEHELWLHEVFLPFHASQCPSSQPYHITWPLKSSFNDTSESVATKRPRFALATADSYPTGNLTGQFQAPPSECYANQFQAPYSGYHSGQFQAPSSGYHSVQFQAPPSAYHPGQFQATPQFEDVKPFQDLLSTPQYGPISDCDNNSMSNDNWMLRPAKGFGPLRGQPGHPYWGSYDVKPEFPMMSLSQPQTQSSYRKIAPNQRKRKVDQTVIVDNTELDTNIDDTFAESLGNTSDYTEVRRRLGMGEFFGNGKEVTLYQLADEKGIPETSRASFRSAVKNSCRLYYHEGWEGLRWATEWGKHQYLILQKTQTPRQFAGDTGKKCRIGYKVQGVKLAIATCLTAWRAEQTDIANDKQALEERMRAFPVDVPLLPSKVHYLSKLARHIALIKREHPAFNAPGIAP